MGVVKLPFVLERFDVVVYDTNIGAKLCQVDGGAVLVLAFSVVGPRGERGPVEASGKVRVGDALMCIDEVPIELLKYEQVLDKVKLAQRPVTLTFGRTEDHVAQLAHGHAKALAAKAKQAEDRKRLREIEAERQARNSSSRGSNAQTELVTLDGVGKVKPGQKLYTSKDFVGRRLAPVHKLGVGLVALILLMFVGFIFDLDVFNLSTVFNYSQSGTIEVYHLRSSVNTAGDPSLQSDLSEDQLGAPDSSSIATGGNTEAG